MSSQAIGQRAARRCGCDIEVPSDIALRTGYATCMCKEVEPLEAEVAKLRALVQKLTDLVFHDSDCGNVMHNGKCDCFASVAIAAAKEHGFVPTNTK